MSPFASFASSPRSRGILSFTRAAEELSLTAPAVSMQIKEEFEAQVGLPVFDRTSRQIDHTSRGTVPAQPRKAAAGG